MKEDLKDIFNNVNDWLKFAEAKHAGLIVLNSGLVFGILTVYSAFASQLHWSFIILSLLFIGGSILFTLISLYPRSSEKINTGKKIKPVNLFFNGSIARLTVEQFKAQIEKSYPVMEFTALEEDLIKQTIVNSKIASRKYALFKYAIICTSAGLGLPLLRILFKAITGV